MNLSLSYIRFWLKAANSKGHGTHSPFVYSFIKNVLNDKRDFYFFKSNGVSKITQIRKEKEINELIFKIIDFYSCQNICCLNTNETTKLYCQNANPNAIFFIDKIDKNFDFLVIENAKKIDFNFQNSNQKLVVILNPLNSNKQLWESLLNDTKINLTINLFFIGIAVVNNDIKVKQHADVRW